MDVDGHFSSLIFIIIEHQKKKMNSRQIAESSHNYQPGDVIFRLNEPLVYVTKYEHRLFTCDQCMRSIDSSIVCPGCHKVYYCSNDCQMKAWYRLHRIECSILAKREPMQYVVLFYFFLLPVFSVKIIKLIVTGTIPLFIIIIINIIMFIVMIM